MKQFLLAALLIAVPVTGFTAFETLFVSPTSAAESLGDLSNLRTIVADVQMIAKTGDMAAARSRITDFETAWDAAESGMRPLNDAAWTKIDTAADAALHAVRGGTQDPAKVDEALSALTATLDNPY